MDREVRNPPVGVMRWMDATAVGHWVLVDSGPVAFTVAAAAPVTMAAAVVMKAAAAAVPLSLTLRYAPASFTHKDTNLPAVM